jgi:hypothetical protein
VLNEFTPAEIAAARAQLDEIGVNNRYPDERDASIVLAYLRGGLMSLVDAHPEDAGLRGLAAVVNVWRYDTPRGYNAAAAAEPEATQVKCAAHGQDIHPLRDDCLHPYMPSAQKMHAPHHAEQPDA